MPKISKKKKYMVQRGKNLIEINKKRRDGLPLQSLDQNIISPNSETVRTSPSKTANADKKRRDGLPLQPLDQNIISPNSETVRTSPSKTANAETEDVDFSHNITSESFEDFELETSYDEENLQEVFSCGRRIINISKFFGKIQQISNHGPLGCTINEIVLVGEKRQGLVSKFKFKCKLCKEDFFIESDYCEDSDVDINNCAVAGTIAIGCGYSQLDEFLSCLNIPSMQEKMYNIRHQTVSRHWEKIAFENMSKAAEKERSIAVAAQRVNKDGIPIIDVIADGCWSKRSYKKNYSALSGAAAIIGKNTGNILYLGIKNKYCQICVTADNKKTKAKEHICFKNYSGPSTGMESQIIVEGFKNSIQQHNLIYGRLISDGDSSTYSKILEARPYHDVTVEKVECRNHVLRNFCNKLQALSTDTKYNIKHRKQITKKSIMSTRGAICKIIKHHKNTDVQLLFNDLMLSHLHGFGDHTKCKEYFCNQRDISGFNNDLKDFFLSSLWQKICFLIQNLAGHSRSLLYDVDSNIVENFNSIIAKFVGGKRINFSRKNSYQTRCYAASVAFNTKKTISRLYKSMNEGNSPSGRIKMLEMKRLKKIDMNRKYKKTKTRKFMSEAKFDKNYGQDCSKPDIDPETYAKLKDQFLESLIKTDENRRQIERNTILQSECGEWLEMRRSLVTASNFGKIIKRKSDTKCAKLVKDLLYKINIDHVASIKHGKENEKKALAQLANQENITLSPCGLFLDKDLPYLGATPDAICGEDMLVEIKCAITAYEQGIDKAIEGKKVTFWKKNKNNTLEINKNHNWYYQIQGQLHISQRTKCLFAVWSNEKERLKTEIILRDDDFWHNKMKDKLISFYMQCILPELIDPRHPRNLPIREPIAVLDAIEAKKQKLTEKGNLSSKDNKLLSTIVINKTSCCDTSSPKPSCSRSLNFEDI